MKTYKFIDQEETQVQIVDLEIGTSKSGPLYRLKKEIGDNKEITKDIDLLISQTKRCSEILKKISKKQIL